MSVPKRGDIVLLNFDPQSGFEQKKRRPALVISHTEFNNLGFAIVCPISSTHSRHGFHVPLPTKLLTRGIVLTEQVKSVDFSARKFEFVETAPIDFVHYITKMIHQFY